MMSGKAPMTPAISLASATLCAVPGFRDVQADPQHCLLEQLAIFAFGDLGRIRADQSDLVFFQIPSAIEFHRDVESSLAAQRGQECVRFFPFDYFFKDLNG